MRNEIDKRANSRPIPLQNQPLTIQAQPIVHLTRNRQHRILTLSPGLATPSRPHPQRIQPRRILILSFSIQQSFEVSELQGGLGV